MKTFTEKEKKTIRQWCKDAIELFLEYRDKHGYDEVDAFSKAMDEIEQGLEAHD